MVKVGNTVKITGGTYGNAGMQGKVVEIRPNWVDVEVEGKTYPKYLKNIKLVKKSKTVKK